MQHTGTKTLTTDRLILHPFKVTDAEAMYKNWAGDQEVTRYLTWPAHNSAKTSAKVLKEWVPQYVNTDYYQWAITVKANGPEPVGSIAVVHKNDRVGMVHIGYCLGRAWWRQGIMMEALSAVIRYFFTATDVNRIEAKHDPRNQHSGEVMQKCGLRFEGTMRESDRNNQGLCDVSMYAILRKYYSA